MYIQHYEYGILPLFTDGKAEKIDIDAQIDDCFGIFGENVCGKTTNKLINQKNDQINLRGIQGLWYSPQNEVLFRKEYLVIVETWDFNLFW